MTVMISSETAKALPREVRAQLLKTIRDDCCPMVSNDEWQEIAGDINNSNKIILGHLMSGLEKSENPELVADDKSLLELDRVVHDSIKNIDFSKIDLSDAPEEVVSWIKSKQQ